MIIENPELLRLWLTIQVRKLCDADPAALSKYVLALIRKDKPDSELRQSMIDQLDVFLQSQTIPFVDRLFLCIHRKEYLEIEDPNDGTVYMLNQGRKLIPYQDLPNPFDTSTSSASSHDAGDRIGEPSDLNVSGSSDSSHDRSMELGAEAADILNTSGDSIKSDESEAVTTDPIPKGVVKGTRGSNIGSGTSARKGEKDRLPRRKSRSPRRNRSRSRDRARRSWSPKEYPRTGRNRGVAKRSPARRDNYNRRRSPRNRSSSPYGRTRSPHRYSSQRSNAGSGGAYEPKRIRSPIKRERSRTRSPLRLSRIEGMDSKGGSALGPASSADQTGRIDNAGAPKLEEYSSNGNRCKDFDERGLCMRGELCPYDHGHNPVVLQDVGVNAIKRSVPIDSEVDHSGLSIPYRTDPPDFHLARPTRPMMNPSEIEMHNPGPMVWGPLPPFHPGTGPGPRMRGGLMLRPPMYPMPPRELINVPVLGPPGTQMMEEEMGFQPMHHNFMFAQQQRHSVRGGRGRGRGGMFDHSRLGAKAKVYNNCSLEVKRIPSAQNTISDLNSHFVQFGKIVNIQINFEDDPEAALITFSSPSEAYAAYKSTEAVLNNRFIRVFWHNKEKENEEGEDVPFIPRLSAKDRLGTAEYEEEELDGGDSDRVLISGGSLSKTFYNPNPQKREISQEKVQAVEAIKKSQEQLAAQEQQKRANEEKKRETMKLMHDLQKKKQVMLIEQIEQQKKLIRKLENSKSMKPEEREELMKLIKTLQESIETIKKGVDISGAHQQPRVKPQPHQPQPQQPAAPPGQAQLPNAKEPVRDILDAELDLYNTELEGGDTVALQQKVAELRSQAYSTGVPFGRGRGGFRGASAGRGSFKPVMRGGSVSRTVDRRTTTLLITHFPSTILPELMAHFAQYGLVPYHKPDYAEPSLTMTYENRKCAEAAFLKGKVYKEHTLDIKWVPNSPRKGEFKNGSPPQVDEVEELDVRGEIEV